MRRGWMMLMAIGAASPALGEQAGQIAKDANGPTYAAVDANAAQSGAQISSVGEFRLFEHGKEWAVSRQNVAESPAPVAPKVGRSRSSAPATRQNRHEFRRAAFLPAVIAAETRFALPTGLLDALIWTESRYDPLAISHAGAAGLGQLMPRTARDLGVGNRFDPHANILGAARYLRQMLDRFGVIHLALAAYNAGPGSVRRARGIPLNGETPSYVGKVLDRWKFR